ncbi:MAG: T9SS type A sorting domain-containing protein [bacterium]|nr:T9SS type A sorting domain-containing protein [bacterium]
MQVDTVSGMDHQALRAWLAALPNLVGAIFIGEIPVAWYESNGFWSWEEFPIDLYFMDLNGDWLDSDGDGIYDEHTGDVRPEIWVSRLYARPLLWDNEVRLLKRYFEKNHLYRTEGLGVPQRALSFVDDDWVGFGDCGLSSVYTDVGVVENETATTANGYRSKLGEGYEWIQLCAHSSPWTHTFRVPTGFRGTVFNYEIFVLKPYALFYNLFACSGTRFVEENYLAGWYIFNDLYGLLTVGSTKTGSMLYFKDFYTPIGNGNSVGEAFKEWFIQHGEESIDWFYGLNILGDPTLKPLGQKKCNISQLRVQQCPSNGWSTPEVVASHPESDGNPDIISGVDGKIWVVWESGRSANNGRSDIYCAYRDMSGWSSVMNIGADEYWDFNPTIGIYNSQPIAIWANMGRNALHYNLYYSQYNGNNWSYPMLVSSDPSCDLHPNLANSRDGKLWLTWQTRRDVNSNIYTAYFQDGTWAPAQRVTQTNDDEVSPVIVIDGTNLPWIFYCRYNPKSSEIWGSHYDGSNWIEIGPISGIQVSAYRPAATADSSGRVWVGWQAFDEGVGNIYTSYYNGSDWSLPKKITLNTQNSLFPDMTTDWNGTCWVVWQGKVDGEWDIYASRLDDTLWTSPEVIGLSGPDINPKITADSSGVWVVWQNCQSGNWNIYVSNNNLQEIYEIFLKTTKVFTVFQSYPNPFTEETQILYWLPYTAFIRISIYNLLGQKILTLSDGTQGPGYHKVRWTGCDSHKKKVASGIYFYKIEIDNFKTANKLIVLQ